MTFSQFFAERMGRQPYEYQTQLAEAPIQDLALHVPTGAGKTAAVILAWLWHLTRGDGPRRLVYLLPMRALVEQTYSVAKRLAGTQASVYRMLGGEAEEGWESFPEHPAIIIGTMDLLLSRMLNRGFAMSRYRWPIPFALLNNDCLIACDEVQLMGNGLATTAQLAAWRAQYQTIFPVSTWWLSATLDPKWLSTPDHQVALDILRLNQADKDKGLQQRFTGYKAISSLNGANLSDAAYEQHEAGSLTLAMVNTVERAQKVFGELSKKAKSSGVEVLLAHSRFREAERTALFAKLGTPISAAGRIVVATQVLEAGVDLSAKLLVTEIAPWASLVQRFGRCNREGTTDGAKIVVLDLSEKDFPPYDCAGIEDSRQKLRELGSNAALAEIERVGLPDVPPPTHVIRRKDLFELFDTTPDLAGADLDISRFIRDQDDADVQVFWRVLPKSASSDYPDPSGQGTPSRRELCSVQIGKFREFLRDRAKGGVRAAWRWNSLDKVWEPLRESEAVPGQVYLLNGTAGGYTATLGWDAKSKVAVTEIEKSSEPPESYERENSSVWLKIQEHTDHVVADAESLAVTLGLAAADREALHLAARWHDRGKSHFVFQRALRAQDESGDWGKSPGGMQRYQRAHFRHELASALAILHSSCSIAAERKDLVAYLAAAHHGKVRGSIRSLPGEKTGRFRLARGVQDGDELPEVNLGGDVVAPSVVLSMELMELGQNENGDPGWAARVLGLLDEFGPFRLAYLEALLCVADRRASQREASNGHS
ncbi:MAG: CRISPR-associated helicase Cas3' [Bryobacteraceae bacterium]|nr:CRISPR-associated helicase Cas3' [Bryobacteraceae bacterium]